MAKGYFASLTYTHDAETGGSAKDLADRYDFIISKYDDLWDFMDREGAGTHAAHNSISVSISSAFNEDNTFLIGVIVVSAVAFAFTSLILVKKRKASFD